MDDVTRRFFLWGLGGAAAGFCLFGSGAAASSAVGRRPNILLVITDDQGFGDVGSHGNGRIDTPVQDRLAGEGARFDRFYVCPVCAPTRAGLMTGRWHSRMGVCGTSRGWERMRSGEMTIAEIFGGGDDGYATGCFGKWHNGHYYPEHPNGQGFDEFVGFCRGHWNDYFDPLMERNGVEYQGEGYIVDVLTDHAIDYMENNRRGPFLCYVAYNVPHSPYLVPDSYFDKYKARGFDDLVASVYGMTECVDDNLGRLLAKVDELGLRDDTIVIFMSDNGPARTVDYPRYNAGMRGDKGSVHEGGVRVPFFIRWPGRIKAGKTVEPIASYVDVLPTLMELAGVSAPGDLDLDGLSLAPLLGPGKKRDWPDRKVFSLHSRGPDEVLQAGAVRSQRWLAVSDPRWSRSKSKDPAKRAEWELYDMVADPGEKRDLAKERPQVLAELRGDFDAWFEDVGRDGFETEPAPIGYPEFAQVDVFVQDARWNGGLETTTGNNGYVINWHDTKSYPEWTVDIITAGLYEISLMYTCPKEDVGSRMQVAIGGQRLVGVVEKAYDPEFLPSPQRVVFKHYYEKPFAAMKMGAVRLDKGVVTMSVKALKISGSAAMDLRAVRMKRLG